MKICHNQPHLIPPMRLVVYEDIPPSPIPKSASRVSQLVSRGRSLASRGSDRASLTVRKRSSSRPTISAPTSFRRVDPPRRRLEPFRPLELSIYRDGNRLSDLPEFDAIDFNAIGEIQMPQKAHLRAKSEDFMARSPSYTIARKPAASLVDGRALGYWQQSSPQLTGERDFERPRGPSEERGLSIVWNSLPGLPSDSRLSPVSEVENIPGPSWSTSKRHPQPPSTINDTDLTDLTDLTFPLHSGESTPSSRSFLDRTLNSTLNSSRSPPSRFAHPEPLRSHSIYTDEFSFPPSTPPNRVTQWLSHHTPSQSTSDSSNLPTYNAAAKRSHFYNLTSSPPRSSHNHARTRTTSISTVSSTVFSRADSFSSMTSMATAPTLKSSRTRPAVQQRGDSLPPSRSGKDALMVPEHAITETVVAPREREQPHVGVAF